MSSFDMSGMGMPLYTPKGSSLTSLVLAAVIPFLFLKLFAFFRHTWPNLVYRLLTGRMARQIASVEERVHPNRLIQDDILIHSILGYVSSCYVRMLQQNPKACDTVRMADYEYTFIYEGNGRFCEEWVPYTTQFKTLFGRTLAYAMELSVIPGTDQAIQVEPGLFVRLKENKHVRGGGSHEREGSEDSDDDGGSRRGQAGGGVTDNSKDPMDRLNKYAFYDMRKYAENMDERAAPVAGNVADDASSVPRPFDAPAGREKDRRRGRRGEKGRKDDKSSSTGFENHEHPEEENMLVLEYRRPFAFERSQALCDSSNTPGALATYDEGRDASDVIESFLARAHQWYLGHMRQRKTLPLMAVYPMPALAVHRKVGVLRQREDRERVATISGRCYVLDSAAASDTLSAAEAEAKADAAPQRAIKVSGAAAVGSGASEVTTTLAGGSIGLAAGAGRGAGPQPSAGKTFKSLFFPGKAQVLALVDDFVKERGSYGVPGVVARLNFFLHGAPGTGKTSFVKALARHLRRDLVVISMSEIVSVDELRGFLQPFEMSSDAEAGYDRWGCEIEEPSYSVRPHQSIYVFEDFDAIGEGWAALRLDQEQRRAAVEQRKLAKAAERGSAGSSSGGSGISAEGGEEEEEEGEEEEGERSASDGEGTSRGSAAASSVQSSGDCSHAGSGDAENSDDDSEGGSGDDWSDDCGSDGSGSSSGGGFADPEEKFLLSDEEYAALEQSQLTVEAFLDVFNGFNISDSFIAVFTTNHPEKVHPAITSSTMMDLRLDMGMLGDACAVEMVEHYYAAELSADLADGGDGSPHLSEHQRRNLCDALSVFNAASEGLSGALLEKMCIECATVEDLTQRLRAADSWDAINVF